MKYLLPILFAASLFAEEASAPATGGKSQIVVESKARASDLVQAFDMLRKDKSTFKINLRTQNGQMIPNIMDLTSSTAGTLLFIKILTSQGIRYQVLFTDDITEINYSP